VSFPGGSTDQDDDSPAHTALREAEEETGLDPAGVQVFATLPQLWLPPSNFAVTPVLGWWREPSPVSVVDPREVHAVYRVPVSELLDPEHRISVRHPSGWTGPGFLIGDAKDLILWGFTAGIISRLFDFLGWTRPWDDADVRELPDHMLTARAEVLAQPPAPTGLQEGRAE
jgi:8-oxo-dGTP pyrophosphatase MutT (NUDIX family)